MPSCLCIAVYAKLVEHRPLANYFIHNIWGAPLAYYFRRYCVKLATYRVALIILNKALDPAIDPPTLLSHEPKSYRSLCVKKQTTEHKGEAAVYSGFLRKVRIHITVNQVKDQSVYILM